MTAGTVQATGQNPTGTQLPRHRIDAVEPADIPTRSGDEWAQLVRALARTDDDELPVFGRMPA
jgi:hypothetical protein